MSKQTDTRPSWAKNAAKSVAYSAQEIVTNRTPFITNTVRNFIDNGKDMTDWLKRNNPFKSTSASKDTIVRNISNSARKVFEAGKEDLREGNLRFEKLTEEFSAQFDNNEFGDFSFDSEDDSWSFDDSFGEDSEDSSSASFSNKDLNTDFGDYAHITTSANIAAIGESTSQITQATFRASDAAVNKIIAANMSSFAKLTTQLGGVSGSLTTIDKNVAQLVESSNDAMRFYSQSQTFMEHTEQTLNDIKAILMEMHNNSMGLNAQRNRYGSRKPKFLENGFNFKEYVKYAMDESFVGPIAGMAISSVMDALKIERPEILKDQASLPLSSLFFSSNLSEKLFPALKNLSKLDSVLETSIETFFNKLNEGDYNNPLLRMAGLFGFGVDGVKRERYNSKNYNKGAAVWNGKSERALQEIIPDYLSSIEHNVELIAKTLSKKPSKLASNRRDELRIFDYDTGAFTNRNALRTKAQKDLNDVVEMAFYESADQLGKIIEAGNRKNEEKINEFLKVFMENSLNEGSQKYSEQALYKKYLRAIRTRGNVRLTPDQEVILYDTLIRNRKGAIENVGRMRSNASSRENYLHYLGSEINDMNAVFDFQGGLTSEERKMKNMSYEEREKYKRQKQKEDEMRGIGQEFLDKHESLRNAVDAFKSYTKDGGRLGRFLSSQFDKMSSATISKVNQIDPKDAAKIKARFSAGPHTHNFSIDRNRLHSGTRERQESATPNDQGNPAGLSQDQIDTLEHHASGAPKINYDHVAVVHENEAILNEENRKFNESMMNSAQTLGRFADSVSGMGKKIKAKFKARRRRDVISEAEADMLKDVTNDEIARARSPEEEERQTQAEIADNIRTIAATLVGDAENRNNEKKMSFLEKIKTFLFGEKGEDGFYSGTSGSDIANAAIDVKNYFKNIFTGKGYTKSTGEIVADTDENLKSIASEMMGEGEKVFFGGENSERYKKHMEKKAARKARNEARQAAATTSNNPINDAVDQQVQNITNSSEDMQTALFGGTNTQEIQDSISDAAEETDKSEFGKKLRSGILGGLSGLGISALLYKSAGIIPSMFMPGGPIGGALVGAGLSILSKNEKFLDIVFGKEENGERIGGLISKDLQEKYKGMSKKFIGAGVVGGIVGSLVPKGIMSVAMGPIGSAFLGAGPVGGAILGVAAMMLSRSEAVQKAFFGEDGDNSLSKAIKEQKEAAKRMLTNTKNSLIGGSVGAGVGAALGSIIPSALSLNPIPMMLLVGSLGAMAGVYTQTDKFKDWFFGSKDSMEGSNGFLGKFARKIAVNTIRPLSDLKDNLSNKLVEWVRYDIKDQLKIIFAPIESISVKLFGPKSHLVNAFNKLADMASGLASQMGKFAKFSLKGTFNLLTGAISAPFKILAGVRRDISMLRGDRRRSQKDFMEQYSGQDGYKQRALDKFKAGRKADLQKKLDSNPNASGLQKFGMKLDSRIGTISESAKATLAAHMPTLFRSKIYDDARTDFAAKNGLADDAIFMAGVRKNEHKDRLKDINNEAKKRDKATNLVQKWARDDGYNDKIQLTPEELRKRNKKLAKIYGKDFKNLTHSEMIEFMYKPGNGDPMEMRKKKEQEAATAAEAQQATIDSKGILDNLNTTLTDDSSAYFNNMRSVLDQSLDRFAERQDSATPDNNDSTTTDNNDGATPDNSGSISDATPNRTDGGAIKPADISMDEDEPQATPDKGTNLNPASKAVTSDDTKEKDSENITVNISEESIDQLTENEEEGSKGIFEKLFSKKGLITLAVGAIGIPALIKFLPWLVKKFPEIVSWIKETAVPALSTVLDGISASLVGLKNILTGGKEAVETGQDVAKSAASYINYGTTDYESALGQSEAQKALGVLNDAGFTNYLSSKTGAQDALNMDWKALAEKRGIKEYIVSDYDMARLGLVYLGNKILQEKYEKNPDVPPESLNITYEELANAAVSTDSDKYHPYVHAFLEKAGRQLGSGFDSSVEFYPVMASWYTEKNYEPTPGITWTNRLNYEAALVTDYINGNRGNYRSTLNGETHSENEETNNGMGIGYGHFMQTDPRWKNRRYSFVGRGKYTTMANGGCGPTALANVAAQNGISITPDRVANMAATSGYTSDGGSNARLFNEGAARIGLRSTPIGKGGLASALAKGSKIVLAGKGASNGIYTNAGHIISARGLDRRGNAIVDDPLRKKSISVPINRLAKGMTNAWSIGRGPDTTVPKAFNDYYHTDTKDLFTEFQNEYNSSESSKNKNDVYRAFNDRYLTTPTGDDILDVVTKLADADREMYNVNGEPFGYYFQMNDKWKNKRLGNQSGTIGDYGCIISAMGSLLAYLTGLDYRPDFYTERLGAYVSGKTASGQNGLGEILPNFMTAAIAPFSDSLTAYDMKSRDTNKFTTGPRDKLNEAINAGYPILIFNTTGEYSDGITGSIFHRVSDGRVYSKHAMVYKPEIGGQSGSIFDPGSGQPVNQDRKITTDDLLTNQGVDRILFYAGNKPSTEERRLGASWMYGDLSDSELQALINESKNASVTTNTGNGSYVSGSSSGSSGDSSSGGFLEWFLGKFSELGKIAENFVESLLTGKPYKSIYDGSSSSGVNSSSSSNNYSSNSSTSNYDGSDSLSVSDVSSSFNPPATSISNYSSLPDWAKQNVVTGTIRESAINSKLLSTADIDSIVAQTVAEVSAAEGGNDYTSAVVDEGGFPAVGIGGFNHQNAAEVFSRIKNSGQITDKGLLTDLETAINDTDIQRAESEYWNKIPFMTDVLARSGETNKMVQDAMVNQLVMSNLKYPVKLYEEGIFKDPRSIIMMTQFGGFGHRYLQEMYENPTYKTLFENMSLNQNDELANTTLAMDKYYKENSSNYNKYIDAYHDRFHNVYEHLGGDNVAALGFGAGVADSLNSSYDIMDTPVAINREPEEVNVNMNPVTNRQDTMIKILTRIANALNNPRVINTATTNSDNIGSGPSNNEGTKNTGNSGTSISPVYEGKKNRGDMLRRIHNRIAKSPRPV